MALLRAILPYLKTLGWAFLAFVAGQIAAAGAVIWWWRGDVNAMYASPYDGTTVTISVLVLNPVTVGVLLLAIRVAGANAIEYLALVWPRTRDLIVGIVGIIIIIAATDAVLYLTGRAIVSPFQVISYTTAAQEGWWLVAYFFATVIVAPAGEEAMFRGYLFRGFARTEQMAWPAIVVISLLWTLPHLQYDLTGMAEIFVAGLFLGWVRWRSGSTLLTFILHALFNLEGTIETVLLVKYFS